MKMREVTERLHKEYPDRHISVQIEDVYYFFGDRYKVEKQVYIQGEGWFHFKNWNEAISSLCDGKEGSERK